MAFFKAEGVAVVLQCESGWLGAVRGFARPGTKDDKWSREATLASRPIVAVTPEHYNRMYRILKRGIPVKVEIEVRNRIGETDREGLNVIGEIPGTDLKDEVVMIGAHFDTWHASPNAERRHVGLRGGARSGAHPQGDRREAAADDSRRFLGRRGAGPPRIAGVRPEALRQSRRPERRETGLREVLGLLQPGLRRRAVPRASTCRATNTPGRCSRRGWRRSRDLGMTVVSNQSVGSTDHVSFDNAGCPASSSSRTGSRDGRPHEPGLLRHDPGRGPDEERRHHGVVRLSRGHGATTRVPRKTTAK